MSIHTVRSRRADTRRLDTRNAKINAALERMAAGAALRLHFARSGPVWTIDGGLLLDDDVARLVIQRPAVVGVGDSLFAGTPSQTYRFAH